MGTSNAKTLNLQDSFLNKVRAEKKTIVIYLLNGFQVRERFGDLITLRSLLTAMEDRN